MKNLNELKVAICNDHAGYELKQELVERLKNQVSEVKDFGCFSTESCDYPDFAHQLAIAVESGNFDFGIAICGTGNGISMAANKHQGIRSALCWTTKIATLAREHNDANVIALPARFVSIDESYEMVMTFLTTNFEGGRHQKRVDKIKI